MDASQKILSDLTVYMKYAKYVPELNRRETWDELVTRNMDMHIKKYPSDHLDSFAECMFLLLGGTGVGYSVQKHHVDKLPEIRKPSATRKRRYLVGDSIEGWADAIKVLMKSYFGQNTSTPDFDFSDIRPKGAALVTSGGKAPGPQPLKDCVHNITKVLDSKEDGDRLSPIEVHDIVCHIADAVLAGGIRRAALISLFSADDDEMIACKSGSWWENNPHVTYVR